MEKAYVCQHCGFKTVVVNPETKAYTCTTCGLVDLPRTRRESREKKVPGKG